MTDLLQFYRSPAYNRSLERLSRPPAIEPLEARRLIDEHGVLVIRGALARSTAQTLRRQIGQFDAERQPDHPTRLKADPLGILLWEIDPTGAIMDDFLRAIAASPLMAAMAAIAGTDRIAIPLSHTVLRGSVDYANEGFPLHQDYHAVNPAVPFNLWIALETMIPGQRSALAFWAKVMTDAPPRDQLIAECSAQPEHLWLPAYEPGDVALFTSRTPHMTTLYGTDTLRWSAEMRYMRVDAIPEHMRNEPFAMIDDGVLSLRLPAGLAQLMGR